MHVSARFSLKKLKGLRPPAESFIKKTQVTNRRRQATRRIKGLSVPTQWL
jgi:hypothetical protein